MELSAEDENLSEEDLKTKSELYTKKNSITRALKSLDLLHYGSIIHDHEIELVMGIKKKNVSFSKWNLSINYIREIIKDEGFFVSSRGRGDDLYILQPHEMPEHNDKRNKANFRDLKRRQRGLHMIDISTLNSDRQKKLEFEILRNASFEIEMANKLNERCRY